MRQSNVSLHTLMVDIADKTIYPKGFDIMFLMEPSKIY